ncbi:thrombospondin type-1 domain-containing protein 8-like [Acipenser ruthenus]|uniref:thrombospondin type-1 domain-containing protein 8-like n=1 Tax=Acipenser ruthenus TaxID=7906 RepID=UPI00145B3467|nr:thrombospondin type-1 domain-containing protein 8-like [Acipenser ruthenus]
MLVLLGVAVVLLEIPLLAAHDSSLQWGGWQSWVCVCDLHKQARIRYFTVQQRAGEINLNTAQFWQEKPCQRADCQGCTAEQCPDTPAPVPPRPEAEPYDSLPVVDDLG